ncbi:hypothetical protein EYR38_008874 [Pleurotus pulmonarius]|nr:hypothetical protein EYR38_008874 [Pleurotus pulmonarius]
MGGFCTTYMEGDEQRLYTIRPEDIGPGRPFHWPEVEEDDINDKSKGDMIAKALVVTQTAWFVIQLVARAVEGLAITELEIMTLAYSLICAILYSLWWSKPYDVQEPISTPGPQFEGSAPLERSVSTSSKDMTIQEIAGGGWILALDETIFGPHYTEVDLTEWSAGIILVLLFASGTLLGCIHCIAWNFQFPTTTERLLWIISSLITAAAPLAVPLLSLCFLGLAIVFAVVAKGISLCLVGLGVMRKSRAFWDWLDDFRDNYVTAPLAMALFWVSIYAYALARITLIIQSFVLLRHLSPSAMQSISWVDFFPHV